MKSRHILSFFVFLLMAFSLFTCQKDATVPLDQFKIIQEDVTATATTASFKVDYVYGNQSHVWRLDHVNIHFSKDKEMSSPLHAKCELRSEGNGGTYFQVTLSNLEAKTTYYYYYEVANAINAINTEVKEFSTNDYGIPSVTTVSVTNITGVSALCSGRVNDGGELSVFERGFCYGTGISGLTVAGQHVVVGSGLGNFSTTISGLSPNTTYYVRAYAKNARGVAYGLIKSFSTTNGLPTVTTNNVSSITSSSAACGGNVTSDGGYTVTVRGVCWSTNQYPTVSNSHTTNSGGTGSFTSTMTGLSAGTTYYVRAYATNSQGTSYGTQMSFTTSSTVSSIWFYYDDGTLSESWGLTNGGNDEWGVMFPTSVLASYGGMSISMIKAYFSVTGSYTLNIYEGGTTSATSLVYTQNITVSTTGWKDISISPLWLNSSQSLWVTLAAYYDAGVYPCCASAGINNPNARWKKSSSGTWYDVYNNNGGVDLAWMIRVYATSSAKGKQGVPIEIPQVSAGDYQNIPSTSSSKVLRK